jgi:hypothetical protein
MHRFRAPDEQCFANKKPVLPAMAISQTPPRFQADLNAAINRLRLHGAT